MGCVLCQEACPANKGFIGVWEKEICFSEAETSMLLEGLGEKEIPPALEDKLKEGSLTDSLAILPRNLAPLMEN